MKEVFRIIIFLVLVATMANCNGQTQTKRTQKDNKTDIQKLVGGGCDGCELMYVGMPKDIMSIDTSSGWTEEGRKLSVSGTVYKLGGKIPAPDVIIYYWQTDNEGYYTPQEGMDERAKRHGQIRGWVKSDINGKYSIYTIRPAPYPNNNMPAHIHTSIKEPSIDNEYYIDAFVFDDDVLLTAEERMSAENRGGNGILSLVSQQDMDVAEYDIILGLNIPNYPEGN